MRVNRRKHMLLSVCVILALVFVVLILDVGILWLVAKAFRDFLSWIWWIISEAGYYLITVYSELVTPWRSGG